MNTLKMASEYEKLRLRNIEDNKKILAELGLLNPFKPLPRVIKKAPKRKRVVPSKPSKSTDAGYIVNLGNTASEELKDFGSFSEGPRRRSSRLSGQKPLSYAEIEKEAKKLAEEECEEGERKGRTKMLANRPKVYGMIPGVDVGSIWPFRIDCNQAGIHRPTVAGIHGGPEGAYSIVLSGGYEDNIDLGTCFTYTGEGGRDLKGTTNNPKNLRTAPQSKDQCLSKGNAALVRSVETKMPVRVVRGFKLSSPFAPEEGYRYDGLYKVEKWWYTTGLSGFGVYKFALKREEDQAPPPWSLEGEEISSSQDSGLGSEDSTCDDQEFENEVVMENTKSNTTEENTESNTIEEEENTDSNTTEPEKLEIISSNNKNSVKNIEDEKAIKPSSFSGEEKENESSNNLSELPMKKTSGIILMETHKDEESKNETTRGKKSKTRDKKVLHSASNSQKNTMLKYLKS